jgi:hypothetical protein
MRPADSLMSAELSLFIKINSLFRISGNFDKSVGVCCGSRLSEFRIKPEIEEIPCIFPDDQGI